MDMLSTMGMMALIFVLGYFLMIRPMKKRAAEMQQLASSIEPGNRVLLTSGVFGTVKHVGTTQMVVELAPDVDVTVLKQAVAKVVTADEEEFEYEDVATGETIVPAAGAAPVASEATDEITDRPADAEPISVQSFIPPAESGAAPIVPPSDPAEVRPASSLDIEDSSLLPDDSVTKREAR